ncbi:hypothetical protein M8C21_009316, partial [Ambrosia artemisiifolia]
MEDKMIWVESTVSELGLALELSEDKLQIAHEAASLAMSDLSTAVVTKFSSLSGIMARHYALREVTGQIITDSLLRLKGLTADRQKKKMARTRIVGYTKL